MSRRISEAGSKGEGSDAGIADRRRAGGVVSGAGSPVPRRDSLTGMTAGLNPEAEGDLSYGHRCCLAAAANAAPVGFIGDI